MDVAERLARAWTLVRSALVPEDALDTGEAVDRRVNEYADLVR